MTWPWMLRHLVHGAKVLVFTKWRNIHGQVILSGENGTTKNDYLFWGSEACLGGKKGMNRIRKFFWIVLHGFFAVKMLVSLINAPIKISTVPCRTRQFLRKNVNSILSSGSKKIILRSFEIPDNRDLVGGAIINRTTGIFNPFGLNLLDIRYFGGVVWKDRITGISSLIGWEKTG